MSLRAMWLIRYSVGSFQRYETLHLRPFLMLDSNGWVQGKGLRAVLPLANCNIHCERSRVAYCAWWAEMVAADHSWRSKKSAEEGNGKVLCIG